MARLVILLSISFVFLSGCVGSPSNEPCPPGGCTSDNIDYNYPSTLGVTYQFPAPSTCKDVADADKKAECEKKAAEVSAAIKKRLQQK